MKGPKNLEDLSTEEVYEIGILVGSLDALEGMRILVHSLIRDGADELQIVEAMVEFLSRALSEAKEDAKTMLAQPDGTEEQDSANTVTGMYTWDAPAGSNRDN